MKLLTLLLKSYETFLKALALFCFTYSLSTYSLQFITPKQ